MLQDGLFAGLIGGIAVVVVFFLYDVATAQALRTPSTLGTLLFRGAEAAADARPELTTAIAYNGIHVLLWVALGMGASLLVHVVERNPTLWYLAGLLVVFLGIAFLGLDAAVNPTGLPRLHLWTGGVLGVALMAAFLLRRHPAVWRRRAEVWGTD